MAQLYDDVRKEQPGLAGVHVATALGNQKPKGRLYNDVRGGVSTAKFDAIDVTPTGRQLQLFDSQRSQMPLTYDRGALSKLRPDQVPRFLGSLTNPDLLPTKKIAISDLVATQNRVDTAKVVSESKKAAGEGFPPVVTKFAGANYIADGHHRVVGAWLRGDQDVMVRFNDLEPVSNAMKHYSQPAMRPQWTVPWKVAKTVDDRQFIFGWASIVTKNGVPVIDKQGDIIPVQELEDAAYDFNLNAGVHGHMHKTIGTGRPIESCVFTLEKQKLMGIDLGFEGWWTGFHVADGDVWKSYKRGELPEFSIGGQAVPIPVEY